MVYPDWKSSFNAYGMEAHEEPCIECVQKSEYILFEHKNDIIVNDTENGLKFLARMKFPHAHTQTGIYRRNICERMTFGCVVVLHYALAIWKHWLSSVVLSVILVVHEKALHISKFTYHSPWEYTNCRNTSDVFPADQ